MKQVNSRTLRKVLPLLLGLFLSVNAFAQQITVSGNVQDKSGETVIGANVTVKGTTNGTITDLDGNFKFLAPKNATLTISFVGYATQEVKAGQNLKIVLEDDAILLEGTVIIGYGSMKKSDLSGSVVSVKADVNKGAITSPQELLQGQVSGLFVQPSSGGPGEGVTMRIRGGASLNASNDPLIVIDGIPVTSDAAPGMRNPLSAINPNDIETMTVLKDASATAIYGSRASNGVIIITTKKGTSDGIKVAYSSTYSVSDPSQRIETLDAQQLRDVFDATYPLGTDAGDAAHAILNKYPDQATDWQDEIFQTAFGTDQNISVSGNKMGVPFRVSLGYKNEDGTIKNSNYERYTAGFNVSPSFLDDHLKLTLNAKGSINNNDYGNSDAVSAAAFYDPTKPVYFPANADGSATPYNGYYNAINENGTINRLASVNPMSMINDRVDEGTTKRFIGSAKIEYKMHFLPELKATLNLGLDVAKGEGHSSDNVNSYMAARNTDFPNIGTRSDWSNLRRNQVLDFYLNYVKEVPSIQSRFDVTAGYSWQHFYQADYSLESNNYDPSVDPTVEKSGWVASEDGTVYNKEGAYRLPSESYLVSFFGRLNYSLMDRYLLTATVRRDGSSKFGSDNRWGVFPSAALAWSVTKEPFMKNQKVFSNLKLRVGYGVTGQQSISGNYDYIPSYQFSSNPNSTYLGVNLLKPNAYNKFLKWEETATTNIAIDYGFLNNRINGSVEFYEKRTKDLFNTITSPAGTNFTNEITANVGKMKNRGVEFNVNAIAIQSKDITWKVGFNATWNSTEITKLTPSDNPDYPGINTGSLSYGTGSYIEKHLVGYTPSTFYVYQQVYDVDGKPIQNAFVDRNQDGRITESDRYLTKSPMPKYYFGFTSNFRYKAFDLAFNMRANLGAYTFNAFAAENSSASSFGNQGFISNMYKSIYETGFTQANTLTQQMSDLFLENSSFLKMDNITLGYNFKRFFTDKLSGRVSVSVQNVFTISNYSGLDPETGDIDAGAWPRPKVYTIGLNLNF
ncbi:MAG: TonB-dependent receptor [Bacteroidaceae bacterium]